MKIIILKTKYITLIALFLLSFKSQAYVITASVIGGNGTIIPNGTVTIGNDDEKTFTMIPDYCYEIDKLWIDNIATPLEFMVGDTGYYTFKKVTEDRTIAVSFKRKNYYITASVNNGCGTNSPSATVHCGDDTTFIFTPCHCFEFNQLWINTVLTEPDYMIGETGYYTFFNVTEDNKIAVTFKQKTYNIASSVIDGNGTITPSATVNCEYDQTFAFTPGECYEIDKLWIDGVETPPESMVGDTGYYTFVKVKENRTIAVSFKQRTHDIVASVIGENGTVTPNDKITVDCGDNPTYTLIPNDCYEIDKLWIDGKPTSPTFIVGDTGYYTFDKVMKNKTIEVSFKIKTYDIVTLANPPAGGTITGDEKNILCGENITIKAIPNYGYKFVCWTEGDNVFTDNPYTFVEITASHTLVAQFEPVEFCINIEVNNADYGFTKADTGCYPAFSTVQVEAFPYSCYRFAYWAIGNEIFTENPLSITLASDTTLAANFYALDFDIYCLTLWDNTFLLNLNQLRDSGYLVTDCQWFEEETQLTILNTMDVFSYSAGSDWTCLELSPSYYRFLITTENFGCLWSSKKILTHHTFPCYNKNLIVYPNPVSPGIPLTIEGVNKDEPIYVYNYMGVCVSSAMATDNVVQLMLNVPKGVYLLRTKNKVVKIVVMN